MHPGRPPLHNPALADHLELGTTEFTPDIWRGFRSASTTSTHGTTSQVGGGATVPPLYDTR
eukprot:1038196-Prymnesium_polylepis.1